MTRKKPSDISVSVRQRLLNRSKEQGEDFELVLTRFVLERFLYRLGNSQFREQFILKGAMLFSLWGDTPHRATRDIDFLGFGESAVRRLVQIFQSVSLRQVEEDGDIFLQESVRGMEIREDQEYDGVRITLEARLGVARIPVQVDIGFGDTVTLRRAMPNIRPRSTSPRHISVFTPGKPWLRRNFMQWYISAWPTVE